MTRTTLTLTAVALLALTGCATGAASAPTTTIPAQTTTITPQACVDALAAADTIIVASATVAAAVGPVVDNIAPAMEAAMAWDADGMQPLIDSIIDLTDTTTAATVVVKAANYDALRDECLGGAA